MNDPKHVFEFDDSEQETLPTEHIERLGKTGNVAVASGAVGLGGCGGGGSSGSFSATNAPIGGAPPVPDPTPTPTPSSSGSAKGFTTADAASARFMLRASLSASPEEISALTIEGRELWLDRKMQEPIGETAADYFEKNGFDVIDQNRWFAREQLVDRMIWSQLVESPDGLRKRIALALLDFFVISANRLSMQWPAQAIGAYWDMLNEHAFGDFRELLEAVSLSPAMGEFLDAIGSKKANPATGRNPDENFARELMQLFSIGLFELNEDGSPKIRNGEPIETYNNEDVAGLAKVFTGFNIDVLGSGIALDPQPPNKKVAGVVSVSRPMTADPQKWLRPQSQSEHSAEEKRFLNVHISAGTGPNTSVKMALDGIFQHPNVGPFFSRQMIQRLVTSNPSGEYVRRVARVFADNGNGKRGDLRAVFQAILLDEEAISKDGLTDPRFGKLREPTLRFIQFARTFRISDSGGDGITRILSNTGSLGQAPFRAPSVFNFFSPDFVPGRSVALKNDLVAPEFQIVNEISVADYINFMEFTIDGRGFWLNDWQPQYERELPLAETPRELVDHLDLLLAGGQLQVSTREKILKVIESIGTEENVRRVRTAILLVMSSTDYLIQK